LALMLNFSVRERTMLTVFMSIF